MLLSDIEISLRNQPVLKAYLNPLWKYLTLEDLVELNVNQAEELRLEKAMQETQFIITKELDYQYWVNLCYVLANGNGIYFDPDRQPRVSVELPGGHRFEAMVGNSVKKQLSISIRIKRQLSLELQQFGLEKTHQNSIFQLIKKGANIVISGGTSSGKTTFLNTLSQYIPSHTRILTVEDTYELDIPHHDKVNYVVSRNENNPIISYPQMIDHLVRSRPDMIIAGEVSIHNAFPIIRMLNSGHSGFMCTVHANSPQLALNSAIPQNIVMAGIKVPNIQEVLHELIDMVIQLHRTHSGKRQVTEIYYPKLKHKILINETQHA